MTFNLLTSLRDAADAADALDGHLTRYTDPAALTRHLRSAVHGWMIHAHEETDMLVLRAAHTVAHQADLASAKARIDAAEDMLADAQEAAEEAAEPRTEGPAQPWDDGDGYFASWGTTPRYAYEPEGTR